MQILSMPLFQRALRFAEIPNRPRQPYIFAICACKQNSAWNKKVFVVYIFLPYVLWRTKFFLIKSPKSFWQKIRRKFFFFVCVSRFRRSLIFIRTSLAPSRPTLHSLACCLRFSLTYSILSSCSLRSLSHSMLSRFSTAKTKISLLSTRSPHYFAHSLLRT